MAKKSYGYARGPIGGDYYEVAAASERYYIKGGSAVTLSGGKITLCLSATNDIFGFALAPQSLPAGSAVTTYYDTVAGDKLYVITDLDVVVSMPSSNDFAQNMIGLRCDVSNANATTIQTVDVTGDASGIVQIVGGIVGEKVVFVKMHDGTRVTKDTV